jgi:LmbE family N-acetylglucosaminyl deacetylase
MKNILVISPHPDDEAIGCGGTIRKHAEEGDHVSVIFLTSGGQGGHGKSEVETIQIREQEALEAKDILHISNVYFWNEPDGKLKASEKNIDRLHQAIESLHPDIIYVPHSNEQHPDHQAAAQLVRQVMTSLNGDTVKPEVYMYEVWTPIQDMDQIVDISPYIDIKRAAIQAYRSQCNAVKFDEAILGLNRYRGEMHSWPGGDFAEVFLSMNN